ncbi:MAG TPA: hypothetical protein VFS00_22090 [Polyangiaceae bacterium]|nr:hypothetical protein [Polyangiaceae bacterium]
MWVQASCSGGGSDSDGGDTDAGSAGAGSGASSGAAGLGPSGSPGFSGSPVGQNGGSGSGAGGNGTSGAPVAGQAGGFVPPEQCGTTQCTDCIDNDGDGTIDGFDADCTGAIDNDEGSFATGIPGDNIDACKQDCFFDGNSGSGDDKCLWDLACDPLNPGQADGCPYNPDQQNCPPEPSQQCIDSCLGLVPNGCDCFGCCTVTLPGGSTRNVVLKNGCSYDTINDTTICPTCTQRDTCLNTCERCEYCIGKTTVPADCNGGGGSGNAGSAGSTGTGGGTGTAGSTGGGGVPVCPIGVDSCTPTLPCAGFSYCLTGCCVPRPQ